MGLGVLEDNHLTHVPGTANIIREAEQQQQTHSHLKYDTSGPVPILLVPQPSDDPNDPLLWSLWKKDVILLILCVTSVLCTTVSPILAATTMKMMSVFQTTIAQAALLTGWVLCGCGVSGILIVPTARVWGKRHLYLLGCLVIIASCIWAGQAKSYKSILWSRVIQGVGLAPFESLVGASVGDMYYVHERGLRMAIVSMSLFGGSFLTPVIAGKLSSDMGWEWCFNFIAIFTGGAVVLVFFFVPETAFKRDRRLEIDMNGNISQETVTDSSPEGGEYGENGDAEKNGMNNSSRGLPFQQPIPAKQSYLRTLALFSGRKTDERFYKLVLRPFPLFLQPAVAFACLIQGVTIGWTVFVGLVFGVMFNGPPLWWSEVKVGYMYSGAFIGSFVGLGVAGLLADSSSTWLARRNHGIYEPEFRIPLVFFQFIFLTIGLFGLGYVTDDVLKYGQYPLIVFYGFVTAGMVIGAAAGTSYIVDAYREIAVESLTCLLVFKNMFAFALTYKAMDWFAYDTPRHIFFCCGAAQICVCVLAIPMYIFGKRNRSLFHRHDILKMLHLW